MIEARSISLEQRPLHALNRVAFGPRPGDLERVRRIGVERWIQQQLEPSEIEEPAEIETRLAALPTLHMTPVALFAQYQTPVREAAKDDPEAKKAARRAARIIILEASAARLIRAIGSPRQLQEVMTAFWFNHFNVFAGKGLCHLWIGTYERDAIRPHALGRFRDLLGATTRHPAMLFYLDNWQNTAPDGPGRQGKFEGINENYARELMELHTLGVDGGYTQNDVIALTHILTGWGIVRRENAEGNRGPRPMAAGWRGLGLMGRFAGGGDGFGGGFSGWRRERRFAMGTAARDGSGFFFDESRHDVNPQTLLGRPIASGGIEQGEAALDLLARSPRTAHHLSYQLAQYFVADDPPPSLVDRMAVRYRESDGNIREVLGTMFTGAEFWDRRNYGVKFKPPYEFVVSAVRATAAPVNNIRPLIGTMGQLGMPLYGCQTPDGYKNTQAAWLGPDAMMTRLSFATALGTGRLPLAQPFDEFVDDEPRPALRPAMGAAGAGTSNTADVAASRGRMAPPDPIQLALALGDLFTSRTAQAVETAPPPLRAPLILGSREFMMR
jgi:uncharacterized protein (DUF1800 family)